MANKLKIRLSITFVLFCITFFLLFIKKPISDNDSYKIGREELFNPELKSLNSVDKILNYTDSIYESLNLSVFDTSKYVNVVSSAVKRRFYHDLSSYSLYDNWIAYVSSIIFWNHLSAIVIPDDILHYSEGLCSQQNIVFMEILKKKGILSRAVGLGKAEGPGHFLCEVQYNSTWHLYDVDVEPNWDTTIFNHESLQVLLNNKQELYKIYEGRLSKEKIDKITQKIKYGIPNEFPAKNMYLFHRVTKIVTYLLPIFFLFLFIWYYKKSKLKA